MLVKYIRSAFRSLFRYPLVTFINLTGLSVGMTVSVLIFLWVGNELGYDSRQADADRIYRVTTHLEVSKGQWWVWETSPLILMNNVQATLPGVQTMGMVMGSKWMAPVIGLKGKDPLKEANTAFVDKGWFELFHYDVAEGSLSSFLDDPTGLVLTTSTAHKYFGNQEAIGQVITLDSLPCTVRAVVRDNPVNSSFQYPLLRNVAERLLDSNDRKNDLEPGNYNFVTFLKLAPGTDPNRLAAGITRLHKSDKKDDKTFFSLEPLRDMHFDTSLTSDSFFRHGDRKMVYIFSVLGVLLLGIACINYVNLTTARASLRAKEVGVRKVMGAGKAQLFLQFLTESALVSGLALVITLALVRFSMPAFSDLTGEAFTFSLGSAALWQTILGTLGATIVLNSIYPALLLSSFQPIKVLRGGNLLEVKDGTLRRALVVLQFSITLVLLAGTIVINAQLRYVRINSPRFDGPGLFDFRVPLSVWKQYNYDRKKLGGLGLSLRNELMEQPGIASVSISNDAIIDLQNSHSGSVQYEGRPKDFKPSVTQLITDSGFFRLFHLEMVEGRWLNGYKATDGKHYILNETAVRDWHIHTPVVGQWFSIHGDTGQIVGVVKDFHFKSFHDKINPLVVYASNGSENSFLIRSANGAVPTALASTRRVFERFFPGAPFDYIFIKDSFDTLYRTDLSAATLFQVFSWIAVLISALGLFGLVSFMAAQRTREIGIRKVLGASVGHLVRLLSRDFMLLVGVAVCLGIPLAWWAAHVWLEGFVYRVDLGWWMFGLAALASLAVALATVSAQAFRSARANPIKSLRTE
jgi:predicted permease